MTPMTLYSGLVPELFYYMYVTPLERMLYAMSFTLMRVIRNASGHFIYQGGVINFAQYFTVFFCRIYSLNFRQ